MNSNDAILNAFANTGEEVPIVSEQDRKRVILAPGSKGKKQVVLVRYGQSAGRKTDAPPKLKNKSEDKKNTNQSAVTTQQKKTDTVTKYIPNSEQKNKIKLLVNSQPIFVDRCDGDAKCLVTLLDKLQLKFLELNLELGSKESIHQIEHPEIHEVSFGLDFGTSSVKVVIGDLASDKAFAIPFLKAQGIDAYLLPSRVFESGHLGDGSNPIFSLHESQEAFRDLKLGLLANPNSLDHQVAVIAFLSIVIQRSRAWFFQENRSIYKRVKCLWQIRIGLPAATALENKFVPLFEKICRTAWEVASIAGEPSRSTILKIHDKFFNQEILDTDLEVRVIPEIAAQIFGFVASNSFDKKAPNRFLMVDVGAGTVDASLFRVTSGRGGVWNFEFYTAVVQPYGVSNLHSYRVDWWMSKLSGCPNTEKLRAALLETKYATDLRVELPFHNRDYFSGVHLVSDHPDKADFNFFDKKLMAQVQGSTLWRAVREKFLSSEQMKNMPMFLCGGGSRSPFYLNLEDKLQSAPGFSWLTTEPWRLGYPSDLVAEEIDEVDFDRLSVAYGLSKVDVGKITQAMPLPLIPIIKQESFGDRYVDKDQT